MAIAWCPTRFRERGRALRDVSAQLLELEQRINQQEALYRADANLLRSLRLDDILQALARVGAEVMQADKCSVIIWNPAGDDIQVPAAYGFCPEILAEGHTPHSGLVTPSKRALICSPP